MCARCSEGVVRAGDGKGGAAVLGHHADGTSQGLQVFWGQADLPTGRRKVSWECSGGLSGGPWEDASCPPEQGQLIGNLGDGQGRVITQLLGCAEGTPDPSADHFQYHPFAAGFCSMQLRVST